MYNDTAFNKIYIEAPGDPSVGINPIGVTINFDGCFDIGSTMDEAYVEEALEDYRKRLKECFSHILDDNVGVMYDFEIEAEKSVEDAMRDEYKS